MNMKKYFIVLVLAVSGLMFSCNDKLDLTTDGRISIDEVFSDRWRTMGWLNSCYDYRVTPGMLRSAYSDEAHHADAGTSDGTGYYNYYTGSVSASSWSMSDGQIWGTMFQGIRKCNIFLENIDAAQIIATADEKAKWKAQAYTLRAFYYWQLVKRYGGVPLFDKEVTSDHDFSKDKRATYNECVAFIVRDCRSALEAPATENAFGWTATSNNMVSRGVPYAIMSEAVLYAASPKWSDGTYTWEDAAKITKEALLACRDEGNYSLYNETPDAMISQNAYAQYHITMSDYKRATDRETIYAYGGQLSVWQDAGLPSTDKMKSAGPCPSQELVDAYEMANGETPFVLDANGCVVYNGLKPQINAASGYDETKPYEGRDPRFYASIYFNGAVRDLETQNVFVETFTGGKDAMTEGNDRTHTHTGYYLRKFNNWRSRNGNNADGQVKLFRYAELLLNYAEAANEAYGPNTDPEGKITALEAVKVVRDRAGMPNFSSSIDQPTFRARIRNERRIELAFEEHRYFDVRRWNILDKTDGTITGMQIAKNGNNLTYTRVLVSDRKCDESKYYLYPINQTEVEKANFNTGLKWQNPGWEQ